MEGRVPTVVRPRSFGLSAILGNIQKMHSRIATEIAAVQHCPLSCRTTFNDSILHAVVRSGNTDLLQLMEEKMWFSSGQKNEALLEAMRESKEEMMEILCRSEKIDRSINPEEIEAARMASESQRILEFFTYIM
ncbi:hypothetical protein PROFUN_09845 [Planoprotostelium fungivorum]|uniref:Uncharacterized protein n=1 Tax=Planoprotostelium fungivorum TaxID=1890364 RepID=A0A2P6NFM4_9EUKA|nr:hypothetical protein PROFUN_09845 [Planoprotostelium fungivorum]